MALALGAGAGYLAGLALHSPTLCLVCKPVPVLVLAALTFRTGRGRGTHAVGSGLLLGMLAVPVAVYMTAIGAMMWRAAARVGPGREGAVTGLLGAMLFGLSDTLIALDRFRAPIPGARYAIILLYWAGQAGITWSVQRASSGRPVVV